VPRLVSHAEKIFLRVAYTYITQIKQTLELRGMRKRLSEIFRAEADLADIEVTDTVKGISRRCKTTGRPRRFALSLPSISCTACEHRH
jgi:hypothetical protein